jgi:uncharacterized protein
VTPDTTIDGLFPPQTRPFRPGTWQNDAVQAFETRMLDRSDRFPCIFGVDAVARGTLRYAFVEGAAVQPAQLADRLVAFTRVCEALGARTSLVCFFEEWNATARTHDAYYSEFWRLLQATAELDPSAWPSEFPVDTASPHFEFCFNSVPMFVVVNTDLHVARRSRAFDRVAITFQPRFVFDDLKPGTRSGDNARVIIRGRLSSYDDAPMTSMLGNYGDATNNEWRQYYLDDGTDTVAEGSCPVRFPEGHR